MKIIIYFIIALLVTSCNSNSTSPIIDNPNAISVGNPQLITENGFIPKWSPVENSIAFTSEVDGENRVLVWNSETNSTQTLVSGFEGDVSFNWSPDGTAIVFDAFQGIHNHQIWTYNINTSEYRQITNYTDQVFHPDWLKNGNNILAMSRQNFYKVDITDETMEKIGDTSINGWHPSANWDCTQFAFTSDKDGNNNIYIANIDGTDLTQITHYVGDDDRARWSPAGSELVFESDRDGVLNVWLYSLLTRSFTQITTDGGRMPDWSNNEQNIVYMNNWNIFTIKIYRAY